MKQKYRCNLSERGKFRIRRESFILVLKTHVALCYRITATIHLDALASDKFSHVSLPTFMYSSVQCTSEYERIKLGRLV